MYQSTWILNLGVVPLFLSAAFLLAPIFDLRLERFVFSFFVSEPINILLQRSAFFLRRHVLLNKMHNVKIILPLFALLSTNAWGQTILSIGEHHEIRHLKIERFLIGNPEVINAKLLEEEKTLILKGAKQGYSEVVIWENGQKKRFEIFVLTKVNHLKSIHFINDIKGLGLKVRYNGNQIRVTGKLSKLSSYKSYLQQIRARKENISNQVTLTPKLRNEIIGKIYYHFFGQQIDSVKCDAESTTIVCEYPIGHHLSQETTEYLKKHFDIVFLPVNFKSIGQNYRVRLKLIQLERLDGEELSFGLDKLEADVGSIFKKGVTPLIQNNRILINEHNLNLSTLAEPQAVLRTNTPLVIEIGADIPYEYGGEDSKSIHWKFAGLRIKLTLKETGSGHTIDYETEFTHPDGKSISGNRERSSGNLELGKPLELFKIGFKTIGNHNSQLPLLGKIPLLGALFRSKSMRSNHKELSGLIVLEETE